MQGMFQSDNCLSTSSNQNYSPQTALTDYFFSIYFMSLFQNTSSTVLFVCFAFGIVLDMCRHFQSRKNESSVVRYVSFIYLLFFLCLLRSSSRYIIFLFIPTILYSAKLIVDLYDVDIFSTPTLCFLQKKVFSILLFLEVISICIICYLRFNRYERGFEKKLQSVFSAESILDENYAIATEIREEKRFLFYAHTSNYLRLLNHTISGESSVKELCSFISSIEGFGCPVYLFLDEIVDNPPIMFDQIGVKPEQWILITREYKDNRKKKFRSIYKFIPNRFWEQVDDSYSFDLSSENLLKNPNFSKLLSEKDINNWKESKINAGFSFYENHILLPLNWTIYFRNTFDRFGQYPKVFLAEKYDSKNALILRDSPGVLLVWPNQRFSKGNYVFSFIVRTTDSAARISFYTRSEIKKGVETPPTNSKRLFLPKDALYLVKIPISSQDFPDDYPWRPFISILNGNIEIEYVSLEKK